MKRYLIFFVALCTFLSCAKTELNTGEGVSGTKFYYAEVPSEDSKAYIDTDYEIHWTADDRISVFCSPANEQYRFTGQTGDWKGTFENLIEPADPTYNRNYAVYPYLSGSTSTSEGTVTVTLPSEQSYAENSFGLGDNTMVAVTEGLADDTFKFRACCGYMMLKLYGGDRIKSITLRGNNGEKIAGLATITAEYGESPVISMGDAATTEITLNCPAEGVPTNESIEQYTQFWIVIPPTSFSNGFTIDITNTADDVIFRSTSNSVTINRNRILKMAPVKVDAQNSKELLSFSLSDGTNTYKAFDISDGYVNVQVPNGTDMTNMTAMFSYNGSSVKVDDVPQTSGADSHDFSDFVNPVTYTVTSKAGISQPYIIRMFNLPIVFATTPNGTPINSKIVWTEGCSFKLRGEDGTLIDYGTINLKGRGNSSWNQEKKPYAVKFDKKKDVLGMPAHKRWCLLSNCWGYFFGNMMGYEMGRRAVSQEWAPHGKYVELFLNGEHKGCYLLTEQIKIDKNRLNITEIEPTDIEGDALTGGYLLTYDNTFDELYKFHSLYYNMPVMFKIPDEDVPDIQFNYINSYINNFEASLKDNTRFAAREYLNYIDVESFIDLYFVWEISGKSESGNFTDFAAPRSVYYYKDRNDVLRAGPVWDFDSYLFYEKKLRCNACQYYGRLFQDPYFVSRVKVKWPEFRSRLEGASGTPSMLNYLDSLYVTVIKSAERDRVIWPWSSYVSTRPASEQYNIIKNGFSDKLDFVESYINSLVVDYDTLPGGNEDVDEQDDKTGDFNFGF